MILLQDNDPYNLTVVNVRPGEEQTVPVVPSGRYCIMELLPMGEYTDSVSREFIAEEATRSSTGDVISFQHNIMLLALLVSLHALCI